MELPCFLHTRKLGSERGSDRSRVTLPAGGRVTWECLEYSSLWMRLGCLFLQLTGAGCHLGNASPFSVPVANQSLS